MKELERKFILFDTNVLIRASKNLDQFRPFFRELKSLNVGIATSPVVELEYYKNSGSPEWYLKRLLYHMALTANYTERKQSQIPLPINDKVFEAAIDLQMNYELLGMCKKTSPEDFLLSALLKHHNRNLFLATNNHSDFPTSVFDRTSTYNVELADEVFCIGFYKFSQTKYDQLEKKAEEKADTVIKTMKLW